MKWLVLLSVLLLVENPWALHISELFPYGRGQHLPQQEDSSSTETHLNVPVTFYGTQYHSIYVNENGLLSFLTEVPSFFNAQFPLTYPIIAPLYSDVDTRGAGRVYYRETQSGELLDRATREIRRHFSNAGLFQARSLFIATWDGVGYYDRGIDKVNTFQVVIASDGEDSYVYLLYPENGVQWIQGFGKNPGLPDARAQAGFMSGDGRLYTVRGSGTDQARNFDRMSNVQQAGIWMFHVGKMGHDGNVLPADLGSPEDRPDTNACASTLMPCPPHSTCVDNEFGFCCMCKDEYFGNGRNCVLKNAPQRMNGKVTGIINDVQLDDADLHAYIVTEDGRTYTAISRVPSAIGSDLQVVTPLGGVVGWLFAVPRSNAPNGFIITGGAFNRTVELDFPQSGDHVLIEERFLGPDVFNYMRVQVKIRGSVPSVPQGAKIEIADYEEEYTRVSPGVFRSHAARSYRLEGNSLEVPFSVDQTIAYTECQPPMSSTRLTVARNFIVYDAQEQIVRYAMTNKVSPLSVEDPCKEGRQHCGPNSQCVVDGDTYRCACAQGYQHIYEEDSSGERATCIDINECALGRHNCHVFAECINLPGSFTCRCQSGYSGDGVNCERRATCADLSCDIHAECLERNPPQCLCRPGYVGDGFTCRPVDTDDCRHNNYCDPRAECALIDDLSGRYECRCRPGYRGNGIICIEDTCDIANNCSPNGECLYDSTGGAYYCACRPGYSGDGYNCHPAGDLQSCDIVNNCHPQAQCIYDSNSARHHCRCNAGYEGDGFTCRRTESVSCDKVAICSPHATCVYDSFFSKYDCRCNDGYEGDGLICAPIDECSTVDNCDVNAQCIFDPTSQRYRCQCIPGFYGDGKTCAPDTTVACNIRNNCHEQASCIYDSIDLRFRCQCNQGYQGDGITCERIPVPCNVINTCSVRARCEYDPPSQGYRCRCQQGYEGDGQTCRPLRSCREDRYLCDGNADCLAHDVSGDFVCHCRQGYVGDGITCTPSPQHTGNYLVFAQGMSILRMPANPTKSDPGQLLLMEPHMTPVGLATDCQQGHLYWADVALKVIRRANYNGSEVIVAIEHDMQSPEGVAVDWLSRTIYWTDSGKDAIEVASISQNYRKVLISDNLEDPRGIAVHPGIGMAFLGECTNPVEAKPPHIQTVLKMIKNGVSHPLFGTVGQKDIQTHISNYDFGTCVYRKLFWSDWSRNSPKIEVSNMDGTGRSDFISNNLELPNMLVIDFDRNNLCWTDAGLGRIECVSVSGQGRRIVYTPAAYPFGIAVHGSYVYWTDWKIKFIHRVDVNGGDAEPLEIPPGGSGRMYGLVSLPSVCPAVGSPCAVNNGGCRHLCLPDGRGGRSCVCGDDDSQCSA